MELKLGTLIRIESSETHWYGKITKEETDASFAYYEDLRLNRSFPLWGNVYDITILNNIDRLLYL